MKKTVLALLLLIVSSVSIAQAQWEYAMLTMNGDGSLSFWDATREIDKLAEFAREFELDENEGAAHILNKLGLEGYELVNFVTVPPKHDFVWTFKRPVR